MFNLSEIAKITMKPFTTAGTIFKETDELICTPNKY